MPGMRRQVTGHTSGVRLSGQRRATEWIALSVPWQSQLGGKDLIAFFTQAELEALVPFTITRTVGIFGWAHDEDFILDQDVYGAIGFAVVRENARSVGGGAVPGPLTNVGDDVWYLHRFFSGFVESINTASGGTNLILDSRAQRKVVDGDALIFMSELDGTSDDIEQCLGVRILCKLH